MNMLVYTTHHDSDQNTMGREVAVVVHIELPSMLACAFQDLAYSAIWVGLGSGFLGEVPGSTCVVSSHLVWGIVCLCPGKEMPSYHT